MSNAVGGGAQPGSITVELDGKSVVAEPGRTVRIGRDPDCDLVASGAAASREHARISVENGQWVLVDASSNGTFVDGRKIDRQALTGPVEARLGHPATGDVVRITPAQDVAGTVFVAPGGAGAAAAAGAATALGTGPRPGAAAGGPPPVADAPGTLRVQCAGRSYTFPAGKVVSIGRDENCDVVTDNPVVSRVHARVVHGSSGWVLEDAGSSRGIFQNGRAVNRLPLADTTTVTLGPEGEGLRVVFLPARETKRGGIGKVLAIVAGALVGIAAIVVGVVLIVNATSGGGASLDSLKRGTVKLELDKDGNSLGSGSGTIIDKHGLILTNSHVAQPLAPGQGIRFGSPIIINQTNPDYLTVYITKKPDEPAKPAYRARVVTVDGYLDLAVVKIYADDKGEPVDASSLNLPTVKLGDSDKVKSGDEVDILGFPGIADSPVINVTRGTIGAPVTDPQKRVDGRFEFNTDTEIAHGNSGGLVADSAHEIIAVPDRFEPPKESFDAPAKRLVPINLAKPLINDALKGTTYDPYKYVTRVTGGEKADALGFAVGSQPCGTDALAPNDTAAEAANRVRGYSTATRALTADFQVAGMTPGQELAALLIDSNKKWVSLATLHWAGSAIDCARLSIAPPQAPDALHAGIYNVVLLVGPNYENVLTNSYVRVIEPAG